MKQRFYQLSEMIGLAFLLGATAMQIFYLEPLNREISWRLVAFNNQQQTQIQLKAAYDNQVALLKALNAPAEQVTATEAARKDVIGRLKGSDAEIADYMMAKEDVEGYLEVMVIVLFALGSLLAGAGRALQFQAAESDRR